jgi:H-type lectin domain
MTYISLKYVVWDETKCPFVCKSFKTPKDTRSHDAKIEFGRKFDKPPKFFFSLTELNLNSTKNVRIASQVKELTKDYALVNMGTWVDESIFHQLSFICLALPDVNKLCN